MFESIGTHGSAGPHLRLADAGPHAAFEMHPKAASTAAVAALTLELSSPDRLAAIAADSDAGLVDRLRALEELKAAACAAQARVAAAFDVSVRAAHARAGLPAEKQGVGVGAQVALARRESPARGGRILGFAKALTQEMPCTLKALSEGHISEWRATLLVRETACLSVADRRLVDREIAGDPAGLDGLGDGRLIARIRKITYRIDQAALVRRAAKAEADRFVSCRPAPDTMTYLTGLLPVAQGVAVYAALCRAADSLRARGDARGRGQIMADTMVERITGQTKAEQVPVEVQLVMTDRTLLAGDREPAHLTGYGIVPAPWARDLVRQGARRRAQKTGEPGESGESGETGEPGEPGESSPGFWLRRLYTAPSSGELLAMDSKARFVPASLARLITVRDQMCRTPWCDAPIRHEDHIRPHRDDGSTEAANIQGLCEACNQTKEALGWKATVIGAPGTTYQLSPQVRNATAAPTSPKAPTTRRHTVEITTPTGHRYRSTAPPLPGA
ncbi:HNH endonuclease signature motif containing protein [Arthrobacter sp. zg-Y1143]|uniref:HNH endonuclease n=1 Tax=Arthrobacter sp. zg-Y1143 TaxID=3049065 RepID=UPI0024C396F4|nr:HNH endonuclease signature motif containing protein [Arthrobacter sp. zg-Y1143]MDK1328883.1 DUF222 domain-containing protein [Arthrobacter sp. zg-Y1143]